METINKRPITNIDNKVKFIKNEFERIIPINERKLFTINNYIDKINDMINYLYSLNNEIEYYYNSL
jgi:hypothetical protein